MTHKQIQDDSASIDPEKKDIDFLKDVALKVTLEFGRAEFKVKNILSWKVGSVIPLNKISGEPLDFLSNGNLVAQGETVVVNDKYGVRITQILNPKDFDLEDL